MSKDYDSLEIIKDFNFEILPGEFVGFIGPSGCGKSTLLSLISGLCEPSRGKIENTFAKQSTSFVFQDASLMPWKTVEKNISLPLELLGKDFEEIVHEVNEKLQMFHLEDCGKFYPQQLSGGMKMRTSLARSLVSNPKLLLMDEPFSSLDELLREKCIEEILEIWKNQQITTILVTHSIPEAIYLCEKIYVLSPRPAKIVEIIELDKRMQKNKSPAFKETAFFHSLCRKIRTLLESLHYE